MHLSRKQIILIVLVTLTWGVNWPVMKLGVTGYPPLTFRAICLWLGVPVLGLALVLLKVPFHIQRRDWRELFWLAVTNMFVWHALIILAVSLLSSGRAAILGYTMPIFSAMLGAVLYGTRLKPLQWLGVGAAAVGVALLLYNELTNLVGKPVGVALALVAALVWAVGTQRLRMTKIVASTLSISFWMTLMAAVVLSVLSIVFERAQWRMPPPQTWAAIAYNGVLIFGFTHAAWFTLARSLPPIASTLSTMMIPVLGVFTGALWLGEVLHWQDWAAVVLMAVAIVSVLVAGAGRKSDVAGKT
jgi:drug/metabolite transporter (DMT)-like permease